MPCAFSLTCNQLIHYFLRLGNRNLSLFSFLGCAPPTSMHQHKTVAQVILMLSIVIFVLAAPVIREIHEARGDVLVPVLAGDVGTVAEKRTQTGTRAMSGMRRHRTSHPAIHRHRRNSRHCHCNRRRRPRLRRRHRRGRR
jgi:hypothetical protein